MNAQIELGQLTFFDQLLKFLNFGIAGIALAILGMTFLLLRKAEGRDKGYQDLIRLFMKISVVFVMFSLIISVIQFFRAEPPVFREDMLVDGQWHQHWAGDNWVTSAAFRREADGLHFKATTYEVMGGDMKGREIIRWKSDGPVQVDAKQIRFTGVRHDLDAKAEMKTKFEFLPGVCAIGGFSGINEEGYPNKLRFYSAVDDTVKLASQLDYCKVPRSSGACDDTR